MSRQAIYKQQRAGQGNLAQDKIGQETVAQENLGPASAPKTARSMAERLTRDRARRRRLARGLAALAVLALLSLGAGRALAADDEQAQRQLFKDGARLWPVYCAQCHNARPGSEFSPAQGGCFSASSFLSCSVSYWRQGAAASVINASA